MKTPSLKFLVLAASLVGASAMAQVEVSFSVAPQLVVVEPGVQVVPDHDEEVFFVDGYYWHRRGPRWYRATGWQGGWVVVDRGVPAPLVRYAPGHYRRWKPAPARNVWVGGPGPRHGATVVVNPPGPGRVVIKKGKKNR